MKILLIDNYDSFTYNLYQYVGEILNSVIPAKEGINANNSRDTVVDVKRNDEITLEDIKKTKYDRIIISPGPGSPDDPKYFGVCADVLTKLGKTIPVLGVCLGMQGMAQYFGGRVIKAKLPMHGKTSLIKHNEKGLFKGLPQPLEVMRYHSLIADPKNLPKCLEVTATTKSGEIMALRHHDYPVCGIQFHPESFATEGGKLILENFLS